MRFRLIEDHRLIWPVRVMGDALSASPSGAVPAGEPAQDRQS